WKRPEQTAETLESGWLHTGDIARKDERGYMFILDRKKDMIVSGGFNIFPREVEDVLSSHPDVAMAAVIGVPHEKWGETIKALVVVADGASVTEAEIIAHCKARLAGYKAPTSVEFRDAIPRTATGKIQKFRLREPYWEGLTRKVN
ncbi:AMP-binding enzyme, partial [Umezawaea sp.]|uniref:AMP-binding enzyme n=1 Tax=Umezawaea sp. TaxID=1955258 RepID=UPI002F222D9C